MEVARPGSVEAYVAKVSTRETAGASATTLLDDSLEYESLDDRRVVTLEEVGDALRVACKRDRCRERGPHWLVPKRELARAVTAPGTARLVIGRDVPARRFRGRAG